MLPFGGPPELMTFGAPDDAAGACPPLTPPLLAPTAPTATARPPSEASVNEQK